ncbi:hypothetical protein C8F01DRAFT_1165290 [Mycena amicta]|nr:hypothetical protein C8F01DRAFT_1165290 [Mycena amicta]
MSNTRARSALSVESDEYLDYYNNDGLNTDALVSEAHHIVDKYRQRLIDAALKQQYQLDKLLDAMLDNAPHPEGARYVAVVLHVAATKDDERSSTLADDKVSCVVSVAQAWFELLMLPMLTASLDNLKRSESEASSSQTPTLNETATSADRTEQQRFRHALALREQYTCAITGYFDRSEVEPRQRAGETVPPGPTLHMAAAHIIPLYLNHFNDGNHRNGVRFLDAATTWDMLRSWTKIDLDTLVGSKINSPENGIFMTRDDHDDFRAFKFYLDKSAFPEPENVNKYKAICLCSVLSTGKKSAIVTFRNAGETPPNPEFLRIHAAFAKVLHLSGAGIHLEDLQRDAERMEMLHLEGLADFGQALNSKLVLLSGGADLASETRY